MSMDTTDRFIEKCQKAQKIQDIWKPEEYDFMAVKYRDVNFIADDGKIKVYNHKAFTVFDANDMLKRVGKDYHWITWLPRIDQLIEILKFEWQDNLTYVEIIQEFNDWFAVQKYTEICHHSPEELWLDFVMFRLYDSIWKDGDWVKKDG